MIKRQNSGFWSVFCSTGLGKDPIRSVFSLFFHLNLVRFWSDFGHFESGVLIGGTGYGYDNDYKDYMQYGPLRQL